MTRNIFLFSFLYVFIAVIGAFCVAITGGFGTACKTWRDIMISSLLLAFGFCLIPLLGQIFTCIGLWLYLFSDVKDKSLGEIWDSITKKKDS